MSVTHLDKREGVVETLETVLVMAKEGKIDSIAIAFQLNGVDIGTIWQLAKQGHIWMLMGAIQELNHRILQAERGSLDDD